VSLSDGLAQSVHAQVCGVADAVQDVAVKLPPEAAEMLLAGVIASLTGTLQGVVGTARARALIGNLLCALDDDAVPAGETRQ
jgi:hypothetical protein